MSDYSQAPDATPKDRVLAGLIDVLVIGAVIGLLSLLTDNAGIQGAIWFIYCITRDNLFNGGVGKMVMKLAVLKEDGTSVKGDWGVAIMHSVVTGIISLVEVIAVLATGQSVGQRIAKTRVVKIG